MSLRFFSYLIRGDTLVLDRWHWIKRHLPKTRNDEKLLDVGCGTGAFTIGAALNGYHSLGLSWDDRNQRVAAARAAKLGIDKVPVGILGKGHAEFQILDVRNLDQQHALRGRFDVALCCECAEHILDDRKLLRDISACLKPGGRLLFTAPNYDYRAMSREDWGPFEKEEKGWHVRRGYSMEMLSELCEECGLRCEEISFCSAFLSQKMTSLLRLFGRINYKLAWGIILPLRIVPILDPLISTIFRYPGFSICLVAVKPRFKNLISET
jgi:SAM-dependent methyltransferase